MCLIKLYIRCKSDVLKAKQAKTEPKLGERGGKGRRVVCLASWPLHHFVNKFHSNGSLTPAEKSYHGEQNRAYHVKQHQKLCQKQVSKVTLHFV